DVRERGESQVLVKRTGGGVEGVAARADGDHLRAAGLQLRDRVFGERPSGTVAALGPGDRQQFDLAVALGGLERPADEARDLRGFLGDGAVSAFRGRMQIREMA